MHKNSNCLNKLFLTQKTYDLLYTCTVLKRDNSVGTLPGCGVLYRPHVGLVRRASAVDDVILAS
jgi:pantothenate synthetase